MDELKQGVETSLSGEEKEKILADIHGTISNILLEKVYFPETPACLTDIIVRHPENDNAVLIWHSDAP